MTHDELIEAVNQALANTTDFDGNRLASHFSDSELDDMARAAIRLIAPAVLEEAAGVAMRAVLAASLSKAVWDDVSALKTRYEQ